MSSHHKEEIWSLNRQLMACHLSDGKSATFITLQRSQKEKYRISCTGGEQDGGRTWFLTALLQGHLLQPVPGAMAASFLPAGTETIPIIIFALIRALPEQTPDVIQGKAKTGGIFIVFAHLCQNSSSGSQQMCFYSFPTSVLRL